MLEHEDHMYDALRLGMDDKYVYDGMNKYKSDAIVPKRCRRVWNCLRGATRNTEYVRQTGSWRYIDLQSVTGRSSSDVKMRELARLNPGLFVVRMEQSEHSAAKYATYRISKKALKLVNQGG